METKRIWTNSWLLTLLLFKGLVLVAVFWLPLVVCSRLGLSNTYATFAVALCYVPFLLKPLILAAIRRWPYVRVWVAVSELLLVAMTWWIYVRLGVAGHHTCLLILLCTTALLVAIHDTASDELIFTITTMQERHQQHVFFIVLYTMAFTAVMGVLVALGGNKEVMTRVVNTSWAFVAYIMAIIITVLAVVNIQLLPHHVKGRTVRFSMTKWHRMCADAARLMTWRHGRLWMMAFLCLYLLPEAFFSKMAPLFLIDASHNGGLGFSPQEFGFVYGTMGIISMALGLLVAWLLIRRKGWEQCLLWMALALVLPNLLFVWMSRAMTSSHVLVSLCVMLKQAGLAFALCGYVMAVIRHSADDNGRKAHMRYCILTIAVALPYLVANVMSGYMQEHVGYARFFAGCACLGVVTLFVAFKAKSYVRKNLHHESSNHTAA